MVNFSFMIPATARIIRERTRDKRKKNIYFQLCSFKKKAAKLFFVSVSFIIFSNFPKRAMKGPEL